MRLAAQKVYSLQMLLLIVSKVERRLLLTIRTIGFFRLNIFSKYHIVQKKPPWPKLVKTKKANSLILLHFAAEHPTKGIAILCKALLFTHSLSNLETISRKMKEKQLSIFKVGPEKYQGIKIFLETSIQNFISLLWVSRKTKTNRVQKVQRFQ